MTDSQSSDRNTPDASGGNVRELNATSADIRILMREIGVIETKVERLIEDRKEDRAEQRAALDKFESKLERVGDDIAAKMEKIGEDVVKLRIGWGKIVAMGAAAGTVAAFLAELAKEHIHIG